MLVVTTENIPGKKYEVLGEVFGVTTVSYAHLRAHETRHDLVCRLLLEKKKKQPSIRERTTAEI